MENKVDEVWLKAAVLGGLWATIEIILGSFFHNLRMPFSGTFLAFIGIVLTIAFYQKWQVKGLIWRAGLICALMKSISPSAVIFGPMIGIFSEALILSIFVYLFGNRLITFLIAAPLAIGSALVHKVISVLILYGYNIVTLVKNIYNYAVKQLHWENDDPFLLIYSLLGIYLVLGLVAALLGWFIGKKAKNQKAKEIQKNEHKVRINSLSIGVDKMFSYHSFFLLLHLLVIPTAFFFLNFHENIWTYLIVSLYLLFSFWRYGKFLRRFQKLSFWWQLFILTLLAGFFISGFQKQGDFLTWEGILIGLSMNFRAIFVVVAFSSLGVEFKNPTIRKFLFKHGFQVIYQVLELSFAALPLIIQSMPKAKIFLRSPIQSLTTMLSQADYWLEMFENENEQAQDLSK